jgi:hypothetical protein
MRLTLFVAIICYLLVVLLLVDADHYRPTIAAQSIQGSSGSQTIHYGFDYDDGRRVVVGSFTSVTIDVGSNVTLTNEDNTGKTKDVFVVLVSSIYIVCEYTN